VKLASQAEDFPRWYQDVIAKAELAENGPVRGTMVIRPYGYSLWEAMQSEVDARIKAAGAENAYFPLFIPQSYLEKEAEHVEGFSPELAVVTHGGGKQLEEPVIVRPTSETVINASFAKWVQGHRDLPLLVNQWANVVRWEMRPRIFLRTSEFLWQEGHTAHATQQQARDYAVKILYEVYQDFMEQVLAIPVYVGLKSKFEAFPGAIGSLCCEAMMLDGKALQMATSHELGQNFSRMFDITFLDQNSQEQHVWQTSWGCSTRMVGGLIMVHGDSNGLRVPPVLAPIQVVILIVREGEGVAACAEKLRQELAELLGGNRVRIDDNTDASFGRRSTDWELKGVPLRLELGPRDVAEGVAVLVRRDLAGDKAAAKVAVPLAELPTQIVSTLAQQQQDMLSQATSWRDSRTQEAATPSEAVEIAQTGFARIPWDVIAEQGEESIAAQAVTVRCLQREDGSLPESSDEPNLVALVARSY